MMTLRDVAERVKRAYKKDPHRNLIPQVGPMVKVNHKDLTDVTVFKGPGGVYFVSEEKSSPLGELHPFWMVDKVVDAMGIAYEDGESHHKDIHPRSGRDRNVGGSFREKHVAMDSARKWAGVPKRVAHPVPDRRAAIAHTKAKG